MRGIRGAITVGRNEKEEIWLAAQELITELLRTNAITAADRRINGFDLVPLFDARQCAIENSLPRCIRVLLLVNTDAAQADIHHVYLRAAAHLRPDLEE